MVATIFRNEEAGKLKWIQNKNGHDDIEFLFNLWNISLACRVLLTSGMWVFSE